VLTNPGIKTSVKIRFSVGTEQNIVVRFGGMVPLYGPELFALVKSGGLPLLLGL